MRATQYFKRHQLQDLEQVILTENGNFTYALINESTKEYYIGATVNIAGMLARLRLIAKGAQYPVLAHQPQTVAGQTNLSSWVIAVFEDNVSLEVIQTTLRKAGMTELHKEAPYGVNDISMLRIFTARHVRNGMVVQYATVNHSPEAAYRYVKTNLLAVSRMLGNNIRLECVVDTTYSKEWVVINEIDASSIGRRAARKLVLDTTLQNMKTWLRNN